MKALIAIKYLEVTLYRISTQTADTGLETYANDANIENLLISSMENPLEISIYVCTIIHKLYTYPDNLYTVQLEMHVKNYSRKARPTLKHNQITHENFSNFFSKHFIIDKKFTSCRFIIESIN